MHFDFYKIKSLFQNNIEKMLFNEVKELIDNTSQKIIIKKQDNENFSLIENKNNFIKFNLIDDLVVIEHVINSDKMTYNYDLKLGNKNIKIDNIDLKKISDRQPITRVNKAYELYCTIYEYFKMTEYFKNKNIKNINDALNYSSEINSFIVLKNRVEDKYYSLNRNLKSLNDFLNIDKNFYLALFSNISTKENTLQREIMIKNDNTKFDYRYNIKKNIVEYSYKFSNFENYSIENVFNEVEKMKIEKNKNFIIETLTEVCKIKNFNKYEKEHMQKLNALLESQWKNFNKSTITKKPKM